MSKKKKEEENKSAGFVFPEKIKHFPWVDEEEFLNHYTSALRRYVHDQNSWSGRDKERKSHISDLSTSTMAFAEAWWCIFEDINYER